MSIIDGFLNLLGRGLDLLRSLWRALTGLLSPAEPAPALPAATKPGAAADDDHSDVNALGRMLASEDRNQDIKTVIGWITIQKAKSAKKSLFDFITTGKGSYGPQDRRDQGQGIVYAATTKQATAADLSLARSILDGSALPSAAIRQRRPGGWVERKTKITSDERIIAKQKEWNEGIYARIANSNWVLYSPQAPKIFPRSDQSATDVLDSVPVIPAVDDSNARKVA